MKIYKEKDYVEACEIAAQIIAAQIKEKPNCTLGLATGSSPIGIYNSLIEKYKKGELDFSKVSSINLDEYKGMSPENDQSYRYFMNSHLFDHVNINKEHTYVPNGLNPDADAACAEYDKIIENSNGIDLQLLGIGHNGHIGFNEPCSTFPKTTHCVDLTQSTIDANARFFETIDMVPKQAYTMGIGSIMQAETVLVIVSGKEKADIVQKAFFGPITPEVPASVLQLHRNAIIVGDKAALSKAF